MKKISRACPQRSRSIGALNDFTIITGGPGTGKTTTVARLLAIMYATDPQLRVALAAPTGKAAVRMAESLRNARLNKGQHLAAHFAELQPMTVHRLMGYIPNSPYFRHDKSHPLPYQVVIVDEASMLDAALFAKLLLAVGDETRLILLGDKDQLASVEAGSLLGDLCQLEDTVNEFPQGHQELLGAFGIGETAAADLGSALAGHVIELLRSRRFSSQAGIGQLSRAIIANDQGLLETLITAGNEQICFDINYEGWVFEDFARLYGAYIKAEDPLSALQAFNRVRILCAVHGGEQGVNRTNRRVEEYLRQQQLLNSGGEFYINRPVMVTGNNYELELFNGDIGIVRPDADGVLKVWFEDGLGGVRDLLPAYLPEIATAYAMTIHKSQGSEYDQVLVILPGAANERLMTRELLYTAVTRARQQVLIQGSRELIFATAAASVQRTSGIKERFNEENHADLA
jgi:exodeoxyribonuclease V alpha subunit